MYINKSKDSTKMLAAPKDGKVCFYDKIDSQSPSITLNAPLTCFVGEKAFNNAVKLGRDAKVQVDGVENNNNCSGKFTKASNIRNTTEANKALNYFGINDSTEKAAFMGKTEFESFDASPEGMKYGDYQRWCNINGQTKAYCTAYQTSHNLTDAQMEKWSKGLSDRDRANIMYGVEGASYAEAHGQKPGRNGWMCRMLGNTEKDDGWRFRGRSFLQLTGRHHWQEIQNKAFTKESDGTSLWEKYIGHSDNVDLMSTPEILDHNIRLGYFVSACFWKDTNRPRINNTLKRNQSKYKGSQTLSDVERNCNDSDVMEIAALSNSGNYTDTNWLYKNGRSENTERMKSYFINYKDAYKKSMNDDGKTEYDFLLDVYLKATNYRNDK